MFWWPAQILLKCSGASAACVADTSVLWVQECVVAKDFGEETTQVLYVFDDSQSLDILNITASLEKNIAGLVDGNSWMPSSSNIRDAITSLLPSASST